MLSHLEGTSGATTLDLSGINKTKVAASEATSYKNNTCDWKTGSGSPEGVLTAVVDSLYSRIDGGSGTTLYVKESGTGNTGWRAI